MYVSYDYDIDKTFIEDRHSAAGGGADGPAGRLGGGGRLSDTRPEIGRTRLGSGVVTDVVGSGGMAVIYKVWNERLEVFRAVKLLTAEALGARFETEAKITAKLRHEGIVEIYNVGEWNGLPYMEMELIDGEDLRRTLDKHGRFPETVCAAIAVLIAEALLHAHTLTFTLGGKSYNGIIHRDLKPGNIMISKHGEIKLTDFGIARPAQTGLHTINGNIVGTLHYLSPEQMEGKEVNSGSDIYSFGTVLYEMATGVKTFPQESIAELMRQKSVNNFKLPGELGVRITPALTGIIVRCLKYDPAKRYRSAREPLDGLRGLLASITDQTPQEILREFFGCPESADGAGGRPAVTGTRSVKVAITPKTTTTATVSTASMKNAVFLIPMILLCILLISYILAKTGPADTRTQQKTGADTTAAIVDSTAAAMPETDTDTQPQQPPPQQPPPPPANTTPVQKTKPTPAAYAPAVKAAPHSPAPPASESDMLRDAAAAINNKQWNRAITILESGGEFKEKNNARTLLLLEAYVESKRFDKAAAIMDTTTLSQDAHFLISAGRYQYLTGNHTKAIGIFESSLTRPSVSKNRNTLFGDALYYIADIKQSRFETDPSAQNQAAAIDSWRKVLSAYSARPEDPRYKRAEAAGLSPAR